MAEPHCDHLTRRARNPNLSRRALQRALLAAAVVASSMGCRDENQSATSARASASADVGTPSMRVALNAEQRRDAKAVSDELTSSRDEQVRISATRALARIGDETARERLLAALSDESLEVVRWAAFGLGRSCGGREREVAAALVVRAASTLALSEDSAAPLAVAAIADAVARCGSADAERTLRAWLTLDSPVAEASALGLGKLAARRGSLDEASFVALLEAARRPEHPLQGALYAFTRVRPPEGPLRERALEVARASLTKGGASTTLAIRALGRLGEPALPVLSSALADSSRSPAERTEIVRELLRMGPASRAALGAALAALAPDGAALDLETSPGISDVVLAVLDALDARPPDAQATLERLANLSIPSGPRAGRRAVEIRCSAARILAGRATLSASLRACDPDPNGVTGKLAVLRVLDQGSLSGARARRFAELLDDSDARVRQATLRVLPAHREYTDAADVFARALRDAAPGVVATAAELIAKHPDRASTSSDRTATNDAAAGAGSSAPAAMRPEPAVVASLTDALRKAQSATNVEVHAALLDATAALGVLSLNAELERACQSENPTLAERAERARKSLSHTAAPCRPVPGAAPAELARLVEGPTRIVFETDAGRLTLELDSRTAPVAATRLRDLVRSRFYDGLTVHRVVPGFVVQAGDPGGDGYGSSTLPPLRCELSPDAFEPLDVGMALSGRDTGNSQFFVTLGRSPHLDGEYSRVGKASPGWERLRVGDRIHSARLE